MTSRTRAAAVTIAAVAMLCGIAGCSSLGTSSGHEPAIQQPADEPVEPAAAWDCTYDPSINDNWHDDVLCTNGVDSVRPNLLPDSGFVTEEEMTAAGEAYEIQLNG